MTIRFTVYGDPSPKARHRTRVIPGKSFAMNYDPPKNKDAARNICDAVIQHYRMARPQIIEWEPVGMEVTCYMRWPKRKIIRRLVATKEPYVTQKIWPTSKPDWDNLGKMVSDALNELLYQDDKQIVTAIVHKRYTVYEPRTVVRLWPMTPERYDFAELGLNYKDYKG